MLTFYSKMSKNAKMSLLTLSSMLFATLVLAHSTIFDMVKAWSLSHTYNHCFLIIPISLYLIYSEKHRLTEKDFAFSRVGASVYISASFLWALLNLADIKLLEQISFIIQLQSLVLACLGWNTVKRIWFPLFFMFFAVPMGEELIPWLRDITATFCVALLKLSDMPVFLDNRYISVPNGDFFVAEACSGINYLIATITLGVIYAHYQYRSWYRKMVFLLLAVAVPIIANGIRAYGIIMIAYWTDNEYAVGVDHLIYGWIWFGVVLFLLFSVGNLIVEKDLTSSEMANDVKVSKTHHYDEQMKASIAKGSDVIGENSTSARIQTLAILSMGVVLLLIPLISTHLTEIHNNYSVSNKLLSQEWPSETYSTKQVQYPTAQSIKFFKPQTKYSDYRIVVAEFSREKEMDVLSSINLPFNKDSWIEIESRQSDDDTWYRAQDDFGKQYWVVARSYLRGERVSSPMQLFFTDLKQRLSGSSEPTYVVAIQCADCDFEQAKQDAHQVYKNIIEDLTK